MAKNKNNAPRKNSTSDSSRNAATSKSSTGGSMKDSHAQVPDNSPSRSGPGGD